MFCPQNGRPEPPLKKPLPSKPVPKPSVEQQKALEKKVRSLPAGRKAALRWALEAPPALRDAAWEAAMQAPLESLKLRPEAERVFKEAEEVPPQLCTSFYGKSVDVVVWLYPTGSRLCCACVKARLHTVHKGGAGMTACALL